MCWQMLSGWCQLRKINPVSATLNQVLEYLTSFYLYGLGYNTINCYRSSISAFLDKLGDVPIGKNEKLCKLLTGISKKRPSQPKYLFVWDVSTMVSFMGCMEDNEKLTLKLLSLKLATLIAFLPSGRAS